MSLLHRLPPDPPLLAPEARRQGVEERPAARSWSARVAGLVGLSQALACHAPMKPSTPAGPPSRDINAVLADHDDRLLAMPGVVGVYVGLGKDGRTPCLGVMIVRQDRALIRSLPREIEGYPVRVEVTGEVRPMPEAR